MVVVRDAADAPGGRDHDRELQESRRADWRFLLPEPDLGTVACVGKVDAGLIAACERIAEAVVRVDEHQRHEPRRFDVVICRNPSRWVLEQACALVRSEGWIYVEIEPPHRRTFALRGRPVAARGYSEILRRLGFADVVLSWHWPSFAACTEIVPFPNAAAVRNMLLRRTGGSGPKAMIGFLVLASGVLPFVVHASIVGRRADLEADER